MKKYIYTIIFLLFLIGHTVCAGTLQTSKTLASTIITNARYILNDTSSDTSKRFWSDAELLVWLNYGLLDIVARTRCLEATEDIYLVETQLEYPLRADYLIITSVAYETSSTTFKGLKKIEYKDVGQNLMSLSTTNEPVGWAEWDGKIAISPLPRANVIGDTVKVHFIDKPENILSTENIPLPAIYDRALTLFIIAKSQVKARRFNKSGQLMSQYVSELDRYRMDFGDKPKED